MRLGLFFAVMFGVIAGNYATQAFRSEPNWARATDRSWFQVVAFAALGVAWAIASINDKLCS